MKKFIGIIITIMMLLISTPHMSTNSFGVPSEANVNETSAEITDAWIEIINMDGIEVWDQNDGGPRSDSYITDGEKLAVNVIIYDVNGIFDDPLSHHIEAWLSPDNYDLGELVFIDYIEPEVHLKLKTENYLNWYLPWMTLR